MNDKNQLQIGRLLYTKDGRRYGNAVVLATADGLIATLLTEGGAMLHMNARELAAAYHPTDANNRVQVVDVSEWIAGNMRSVWKRMSHEAKILLHDRMSQHLSEAGLLTKKAN